MDFDDRLIYEIKRRPLLYDSKHRFYKHNGKRMLLWEDVARSLTMFGEITSVDCQKKWKAMKKKYKTSMMFVSEARNYGRQSKPIWKLHHKMTFLDEFMFKTRVRATPVVECIDIDSMDDADSVHSVKLEPLENPQLESVQPQAHPQSQPQSEQYQATESASLEQQDIPLDQRNFEDWEDYNAEESLIKTLIDKIDHPPPLQTSVEQFCQALATSLGQLPEIQQDYLKVEFQRLLFDVKYGRIQVQ